MTLSFWLFLLFNEKIEKTRSYTWNIENWLTVFPSLVVCRNTWTWIITSSWKRCRQIATWMLHRLKPGMSQCFIRCESLFRIDDQTLLKKVNKFPIFWLYCLTQRQVLALGFCQPRFCRNNRLVVLGVKFISLFCLVNHLCRWVSYNHNHEFKQLIFI